MPATAPRHAKPDRLLAFPLDASTKAALAAAARAQERSIAAQARHYIRRGLERDHALPPPTDDPAR